MSNKVNFYPQSTNSLFTSRQVCKITAATYGQLKYWDNTGLIKPTLKTKSNRYYSFRDIVQIRVAAGLKKNGLSVQKLRKGLANLSKILPNEPKPLARLIIKTDGFNMIVVEKGRYFNAITTQRLFEFDTEILFGESKWIEKQYSSRGNSTYTKSGTSNRLYGVKQ